MKFLCTSTFTEIGILFICNFKKVYDTETKVKTLSVEDLVGLSLIFLTG